MDFSNFILTDEEQILFNRFKKSDSAYLTKSEFLLLRNRGLLKGLLGGQSDCFDIPESGICELSDKGKQVKAYQQRQIKTYRTITRRYWITTGIAVAALIKSFWPEIRAGLVQLLTLLTQL